MLQVCGWHPQIISWTNLRTCHEEIPKRAFSEKKMMETQTSSKGECQGNQSKLNWRFVFLSFFRRTLYIMHSCFFCRLSETGGWCGCGFASIDCQVAEKVRQSPLSRHCPYGSGHFKDKTRQELAGLEGISVIYSIYSMQIGGLRNSHTWASLFSLLATREDSDAFCYSTRQIVITGRI